MLLLDGSFGVDSRFVSGGDASYVIESSFDAVLPLPAESCALLAGICTVTVPSVVGVTVNVYVVPEPERLDAVPLVTLISPSASPVTDLVKVAVTLNAVFVGEVAAVARFTVGLLVVIVHVYEAGVASVLPAVSFALTLNVWEPSERPV